MGVPHSILLIYRFGMLLGPGLAATFSQSDELIRLDTAPDFASVVRPHHCDTGEERVLTQAEMYPNVVGAGVGAISMCATPEWPLTDSRTHER